MGLKTPQVLDLGIAGGKVVQRRRQAQGRPLATATANKATALSSGQRFDGFEPAEAQSF